MQFSSPMPCWFWKCGLSWIVNNVFHGIGWLVGRLAWFVCCLFAWHTKVKCITEAVINNSFFLFCRCGKINTRLQWPTELMSMQRTQEISQMCCQRATTFTSTFTYWLLAVNGTLFGHRLGVLFGGEVEWTTLWKWHTKKHSSLMNCDLSLFTANCFTAKFGCLWD